MGLTKQQITCRSIYRQMVYINSQSALEEMSQFSFLSQEDVYKRQALGESSEIISRKALAISCILKGVTVFFVFIVSYFTIIHIYNRFDTNLQNMHNLTIRIRYTI